MSHTHTHTFIFWRGEGNYCFYPRNEGQHAATIQKDALHTGQLGHTLHRAEQTETGRAVGMFLSFFSEA